VAALAGREETDVLWGMRSHVRSSTRGLDLVKEDVNAGMVCRMVVADECEELVVQEMQFVLSKI